MTFISHKNSICPVGWGHEVPISSYEDISWLDLVALRNSGKLTPGRQYRIIDYHCMTTQENTQSADNQFDIIVTADSTTTLNENARAIQHFDIFNMSVDIDGTTYFYVDTVDVRFDDLVKEKMLRFHNPDNENRYYLVQQKTDPGAAEYLNYWYYDQDDEGIVDFYERYLLIFMNSSDPSGSIEIHGINGIDYYFAKNNLAAWELKYCLDNDCTRFAWAQQQAIVVHKGDDNYNIYMRYPIKDALDSYAWAHVGGGDDFDNADWDNPDDTTIIYTSSPTPAINEAVSTPGGGARITNIRLQGGVIYYMKDEFGNECPYDFKNIQFKRKLTNGEYDPNNGDYTWVYTFTWVNENNTVEDLSIVGNALLNDDGQYSGVYDNVIKPISTFEKIMPDSPTKFGIALNDIVFLSSYYFDDGFCYGCYSNTFWNNCQHNTFGNRCNSNTFGNYCQDNTFGNACRLNIFGNGCSDNTFGVDCSNNTFGDHCQDNIFTGNCQDNIFGNNCQHNTFGNACRLNIFGNGCNSIRVQKDYVFYIIVENGNSYIDITSTQTTSFSNKLRNFTIAQGVNNTTTRKTISHNTVNDTFQTIYQPANSQVISV